MLSYQHIYHAGNAADVHKHAVLSVALAYLTAKDKPLTYIETHAGRGLYDLGAPEAVKTGEAAQGIDRLRAAFPTDHPYRRALSAIADRHGGRRYPGSPAIALTLLRPGDSLHLAELHPREHAALSRSVRGKNIHVYKQDGLALAQSLCPPTPRRGLMLVDPSYEVKDDYARLPKWLGGITRKWNVGGIILWYPILTSGLQEPMVRALRRQFPQGLVHEVAFPPARPGHGMVGSGLFLLNPAFGVLPELDRIASLFETCA